MTKTITVDSIIDTILKNEGGYVNHVADRGGPTNFGVTQRVYSEFLGRPASIDDVKNMKIETARQIFKNNYYLKPKLDRLPLELQPVITDASVLYGHPRAIIFLQNILLAAGHKIGKADGVIGPATILAAETYVKDQDGAKKLVNLYCDERIAFCERIVASRPSQKVFLKGWTKRANSFRVK